MPITSGQNIRRAGVYIMKNAKRDGGEREAEKEKERREKWHSYASANYTKGSIVLRQSSNARAPVSLTSSIG